MKRKMVQLAVFVAIEALTICFPPPAVASDNPTADEVQLGRAVYGRTCVVCHGPQGG